MVLGSLWNPPGQHLQQQEIQAAAVFPMGADAERWRFPVALSAFSPAPTDSPGLSILLHAHFFSSRYSSEEKVRHLLGKINLSIYCFDPILHLRQSLVILSVISFIEINLHIVKCIHFSKWVSFDKRIYLCKH